MGKKVQCKNKMFNVQKILIFAVIMGLLASGAGFTEGEGVLELEDIFVWGEDRSQLPGLEKKDMFFLPHIRKFNFIKHLRIKNPLKLNPLDNCYTGISGLRIQSGLGSFGEYVLRITKGGHVKDSWFYDCDVMGNRKFIENQDFNYSDLRGSFNIGKSYRVWGWKAATEGIASEAQLEKDIYRVNAEVFINAGKFSFSPEFTVKGAGIDGEKGKEYNCLVSAKAPLSYNQWIVAGLGINEFGLNNKSKNWSEVQLSYINTLFRDFSFLVNTGYRNKFGGKITFGSRLTGKILDTGYSVYFEKKNLNRDLYVLCKTYPYLRFSGIYETETRNTFGFKVIRDLKDIALLNLDFNYSSIKDYLTMINSGDRLFPVNLNKKVDLSEIEISLKRKWVTLSSIYRNSSVSIPYSYSELKISISPEIYLFRFYSSFDYVGSHNIWEDRKGDVITDVEPYCLWNIEFSYDISERVNLKAGVENLLGEKVLLRGGFYENEPKIYIMAVFGIKESKKGGSKL